MREAALVTNMMAYSEAEVHSMRFERLNAPTMPRDPVRAATIPITRFIE